MGRTGATNDPPGLTHRSAAGDTSATTTYTSHCAGGSAFIPRAWHTPAKGSPRRAPGPGPDTLAGVTAPLDLIATCGAGLESVVARELSVLGFEPKPIGVGRVLFRGGPDALCRANLHLRAADRVLVRLGEFPAADFGALFDGIAALPWEAWIPPLARFPVDGRSVRSRLSSVPACQKIAKKAIVERLRHAHAAHDLPETGPEVAVEVALLKDVATLTLDSSGVGLHKRGYRPTVGEAALKETLAAGLVLLAGWTGRRPLVDPFCGTGTIAIEAAMIALNIAPGLARTFAAEHWPAIPTEAWASARERANAAADHANARGGLEHAIHASDVDEHALALARRHAQAAGVERHIHFKKMPFADLSSKVEFGVIITNPPYGLRMGDERQAEALYRSFPAVLRRLPTWSFHVLSGRLDLEGLVQKEATRRRKLYNARVECTFYSFLGPKPPWMRKPHPLQGRAGEGLVERSEPAGAQDSDVASERADDDGANGTNARPRPSPQGEGAGPVFVGGLRERDVKELAEFEARLTKNARHLRRWPDRGVPCYRLYEKDCPDVPLVVDRYDRFAHVVELERGHSRAPAQQADWLDRARDVVARVLEIPPADVFVKDKPRQRGLTQHERKGRERRTAVVEEGGLKFEINLSDYVDTGLFLDHRVTRGMVREAAAGKRFLNLFCYTGAFTVYAAAGGAAGTTSVDLSNTYLEWAARNLSLNGFHAPSPTHRLVRADSLTFLESHAPGPAYDLAVVDPPTYSRSKRTEEDWDVQAGHVRLLSGVIALMAPGGMIYFSTNYRRFRLDEAGLGAAAAGRGLTLRELSARTVPTDFRNRRIHRCWRLVLEAP
ncbi:MAG: bifunctional 23S rRNA (guanine(2069)-N(7))-methyltransferase RlmK/23S rRNA (guanine(2445)-N(2))-methyltransferase RlmL [Phycisphaerae bacterium]|nr:bifunctional 23S rRNA (guanine(2069)-N(7))-methyltransferase RlmK/23S rRNA (guanine(2445)-N(2))-methyltransferase RlmL [Phycisphaerae bacterium]